MKSLHPLRTLKSAGLKTTLARKEILALFSYTCKPISAEYIYEHVRDKKINLVTIYRTLTSFEKAGIIKRIDIRKDSLHYERTDHHHHHMVCTNCGMTESFEGCNVIELSKKLLAKSPLFSSLTEHSLEFFGMCTSCSQK